MAAEGSQEEFSENVAPLKQKAFVSLAVLIANFDKVKYFCEEDQRCRTIYLARILGCSTIGLSFPPTVINENDLQVLQMEAMAKLPKDGSIPDELRKELDDYLHKIYTEFYKFLNTNSALLSENSNLKECIVFNADGSINRCKTQKQKKIPFGQLKPNRV
ncbi:hypothetical protein HNY73_010463 [Argiope bruennichi]|uniref:Uncharacterized protein n=1 Tax=Argiope bruennichi TaxID=94029 RepID=A0A8T0F148_ARGBR|nr:hypothetical protein HNY73_010463 [Argiope bruennichi]